MFLEDQRKLFFDEIEYFFIWQLFEDEYPASAEQRVIHGETRILRRRSDKDESAFFYIGKQCILLCLVSAMDFVQEYDSGFPVLEILFRLIDKFQ